LERLQTSIEVEAIPKWEPKVTESCAVSYDYGINSKFT